MKQFLILFVIMLGTCLSYSQGSVDIILGSIEKNNKSLLAFRQQAEAKKLEYRTGLNPENPKVDYDYLIGSPEGAGNQTDFSITQAIDFPSAYFSKKAVSREQIAKIDLDVVAMRQNVLLEAKQLCLHIIYLNKKELELTRRLQNSVQLQKSYEKKLEAGEATILDLNKSKYLLFQFKTEAELNKVEIKNTLSKLTELNGGKTVALADTVYPLPPEIPAFSRMDSLIEANNMQLKIFNKEKDIFSERIKLSRGMALPKLEAGFHYQAILGQKYQGAHIGFTIPLWQNTNTIKTEKANLLFSDLKIGDHRNEHYHENLRLYEMYLVLKRTMADYAELFSSTNTIELLNKSLNSGNMNAIQYVMELSSFYSAYDIYLKTEKEYHASISTLFKYQL
jgi:outer membrane protein, heavy metal efflux system